MQASEIAIEQAIGQGPTIEVFIDSSLQIVSGNDHKTVYLIDRIYKLQEELSIDLPADPESAKSLALQRFQRMNTQLSRELENAAKGLVQAMQYGIDRYPAIVFDGQAVVYGLTDIPAATQLYQRWQAESATQ
ncbi:TIGR03757 family integrating conjugative element protein [Seongchinamella sediminis]|uniref:TIGR03757 family integrating conjugative element protein n=1 Tax=Seongchinamella sediminis TaxID=2283635 RepID=UPI001EF0000D|nr:TIGR03757 family integrating conjugative element protein [Seongchinamella sediminis]